MMFNDSAGGTGIVQEINDICGSDNNSYPLASKVRRVNAALDRFFTLAFQANGLWSLDDFNNEDLPVATTDLVSGQQDYALDIDFLTIKGVFAKDQNGEFHELTKATTADGILMATRSGTPTKYDLIDNSIFLDAIPNYDSDEGLKAHFERAATRFTTADTTKVPGIPLVFHQYLCRYAALPHLIEFQKGQRGDIAAQIAIDEAAILNYFSTREKGAVRRMTAKVEDTR